MAKSIVYMLPSRNFMVSSLTLRYLTHFKFVFVYSVRECSNFILLHTAVLVFPALLIEETFFFFFLVFIYLFCCAVSLLWHAGSLVAECWV